jgi:hypothetical protein
MNKIKSFKIKLAWIGKTVHVYFVDDVVEFRNGDLLKRFPMFHVMEDKSYCEGLHSFNHEYYDHNIIILKNNVTPGTIAHECYHAVCNICKQKDINDEETYAYLLDYLVDEIINFKNK